MRLKDWCEDWRDWCDEESEALRCDGEERRFGFLRWHARRSGMAFCDGEACEKQYFASDVEMKKMRLRWHSVKVKY
ncbi:hypothetical protein ACOSP7_028939 [Xanthoceras sorbifolium]